MFYVQKYRPRNITELTFNHDKMAELIHIASFENIPHIIISGCKGSGKKTLLNIFLEYLYDDSVHHLEKNKFSVTGSSGKKEIEILRSNYHIVIEPTNTNHDKYILQEIIKKYATFKPFDIFKTSRKFKTIVIRNIECLTNNSQAALRRTMEIYAKTCRFVILCNNLSKVFDPLKSRCRNISIPLPSKKDIENTIDKICIMENFTIPKKIINQIILSSDHNLKKAIWMLQCYRIGKTEGDTIENLFQYLVDTIIDMPKSNKLIKTFDSVIRGKIYNILIQNISGTEIICHMMQILISKIDHLPTCYQIIQAASQAEHNMVYGRRDIIHIDFFVASVIKILYEYYKK